MIRISDVQRITAELYGLPVDVMREPDGMQGIRERRFARPRQVAMYVSRKVCSDGTNRYQSHASLPIIGKHFGGRDHTTVLHAIKTVEKLIRSDSEERKAVGEIGLRLIERANV